jgi:allantoate deiminase
VSALDIRAMGERTQGMIDALAAISAEPDRLTRLYLSPEHKRAAHQVGEWMRRAGMQVRMDAAATMHGFLPAGIDGPRAGKKLLLGSHIDTIIDAGRFDGILGVVAAIAAVEELRARGIKLPFGLEILAFGDEEGVRFPKTLLGSSTVAGIYEPDMLELTDAVGVPIGKALVEFGGDPQSLPAEGMRRGDVIGYLEVHIEQGPVLERAGEALGVVTAIASQGRYRLRVTGEAGHAGTVPMELRHDALATAAEIVLLVEELARKGARHALVGTVGEITVSPGASNVIPGAAQFSLDIRASTDEARTGMAAEVRSRIRQIGARRGVIVGMETVHEKPVAVCAPRLKRAIAEAIHDTIGHKARELVSGAGHDGQAMIHLTDIGMMFVRCRAGISHNPLEFATVEDIGLAVEALVRTIEGIAQSDSA